MASPYLASRDPQSGKLRGESISLAADLGREIGVPVLLIPYDSPAALLHGATADSLDVAFMPYDTERAKVMDFGPAYAQLENTFLVPAGSNMNTLADIDRLGVRVAVQEGSIAQARLQQVLKYATLVSRTDAAGMGAALRSGQADAAADERAVLAALAGELPGARVMEGSFATAPLAIAVSRGRPSALAYASSFIKRSAGANPSPDSMRKAAGSAASGDSRMASAR